MNDRENSGPGRRPPPPKAAVALEYVPGKHRAPVVAAKGTGAVAERILALAKKHKIPVQRDPDLVQVLVRLDLDRAIPPELYAVIAEIFAFVYTMNNRRRNVA